MYIDIFNFILCISLIYKNFLDKIKGENMCINEYIFPYSTFLHELRFHNSVIPILDINLKSCGLRLYLFFFPFTPIKSKEISIIVPI